jgi:hypothetical protein
MLASPRLYLDIFFQIYVYIHEINLIWDLIKRIEKDISIEKLLDILLGFSWIGIPLGAKDKFSIREGLLDFKKICRQGPML